MVKKIDFKKFVDFVKSKFARKKSSNTLIQFEDFLKCESVGRMLGMTFLPKSRVPLSKLRILNGRIVQLSLFGFLFLYLMTFVKSSKTDQMHVMIENVIFIGIDLVAMLKTYRLYYNQLSKVHKIIDKLDEHFPHSSVDQLTLKVNKHLRMLKIFDNLLFVSYNLTLLQFCTTPFLHQMYGKMRSIDIEMEQIFTLCITNYQFNVYVYPFVYILEAWFAYYAVHFVRCTDLIFSCLMQILTMEFDILGQMMSEIDPTEGEDKAIKKLTKLVDIHQELIEVSEMLNEIFSPFQLMNVFCSIAALCSASFLVVVS